MTSRDTNVSAMQWALDGLCARLTNPQTQASVDLCHPQHGLHEIVWNERRLQGNLLGVTASSPTNSDMSWEHDVQDHFIRGNDLVVCYRQSEVRPFSLEVYWRLVTTSKDVLIVDAIISWQTELLESFPFVTATSQLPFQQAWLVPIGHEETCKPAEAEFFGHTLNNREKPLGILLSSTEKQWSYLEMSHPDDPGEWRVNMVEKGRCQIKRNLGGDFQEKGVIRRMRIRGCLLTGTDNHSLATELLKDFRDTSLPLTV